MRVKADAVYVCVVQLFNETRSVIGDQFIVLFTSEDTFVHLIERIYDKFERLKLANQWLQNFEPSSGSGPKCIQLMQYDHHVCTVKVSNSRRTFNQL